MINIVYASDNNYVPYLAVAISSICSNNNTPITFYVLENEINESNKSFLKDYEKIYSNIEIVFLECTNLEDKLNLPDFQTKGTLKMNINTYSRLFISNLLPADVEKVLYLDCDTLVLDSLDELWNVDIQDYMCAGVDDPAPIALKETIGFESDELYVNAGVLLINLDMWRKENVDLKFLDFLKKYDGKSIHHDQGIINGVLRNKILKIHPKYNYLAYFYGKNDIGTVIKWNGCNNYYAKELMDEASKNPVIKHCKPWQSPEDYERYIELSGITDKTIFINKKRSNSELGNLYESFLENAIGRLFLKLIPSAFAVNIKNYIVRKQLDK